MSGGPGEVYPDGLTESVIDALLDEVDRELVAGECSATVRVSRDFTDQRRARRAARRAGRVVLRSLPVRLDPAELGWEAA
ncbi:hypothetical protein [Amycolatopsis cihanbeyliensis]|uniref:hypothetical protein n=1 Tax=Amycolatopsis cihanbeyliensis TaxID=1128664 RepID=UPI001FE84236|nr:hypothetical protein [Amycolatopsis cihanbeyliensis]